MAEIEVVAAVGLKCRRVLLGPVGEGGDPGREILEQATRVAMGGAMSSKRWLPVTRSAGWPAMAR
jgi:hypothetical protein